jgi:hypothetical protein
MDPDISKEHSIKKKNQYSRKYSGPITGSVLEAWVYRYGPEQGSC